VGVNDVVDTISLPTSASTWPDEFDSGAGTTGPSSWAFTGADIKVADIEVATAAAATSKRRVERRRDMALTVPRPLRNAPEVGTGWRHRRVRTPSEVVGARAALVGAVVAAEFIGAAVAVAAARGVQYVIGDPVGGYVAGALAAIAAFVAVYAAVLVRTVRRTLDVRRRPMFDLAVFAPYPAALGVAVTGVGPWAFAVAAVAAPVLATIATSGPKLPPRSGASERLAQAATASVDAVSGAEDVQGGGCAHR
jgi:hypothetical protein